LPGRFTGPSDLIDLAKLERETRFVLFLGLLVAIGIYASAATYFTFQRSIVTIPRPITVELRIMPPVMRQPLSLPRKQMHKHQIEGAVVRVNRTKPFIPAEPAKMETSAPDMGLPEYRPAVEIETASSERFIEQTLTDISFGADRLPEARVGMREEMISLEDLDYGRYKAMVIQNPRDVQAISGFVRIATVWGEQLQPPDDLKRGLIQLAEAVNRYTGIHARFDDHLYLSDRRLHEMPFIYLTTDDAFELTDIERANLERYLRNGGFAVVDNGTPQYEYGKAEASLRQMLRDTLGNDAIFLPIENTHPLYHSFFDFDNGPPLGYEAKTMTQTNTSGVPGNETKSKTITKPVLFLEGIWIDNRMVAIYSDKGYAIPWREFINNIPQLKMGVNMVVFALTQEGGITRKQMEYFSSR
jgi:hypothetical protein